MTLIPNLVHEALPGLLQRIGVSGSSDVVRLTGDASNRSYFRIRAGGRSFVVMKLADVGPNSVAEEITKVSRAVTELPFVDIDRYLEAKGVHVPKIFGYDRERGVLLLEDFGDDVLLDVAGRSSREQVRSLYMTALDELAKIAVIAKDDPKTSVAFSRRFDRDLYHWEFVHFVEYGLDRRLKNPPKGGDRDAILGELGRLIVEYLSWEPLFCHRDYHSRNLMVIDGGLGILDFQDALLGPLFYDLASLLRDSYIALEPELQNELVETYRQKMKPLGLRATASKDEFRRAFDLMGLHRNLKAAGRFCYIDEVKKNPRYLADVPRTLDYVAQTLDRYPDLRRLRDLIAPHLPEVSEACRR